MMGIVLDSGALRRLVFTGCMLLVLGGAPSVGRAEDAAAFRATVDKGLEAYRNRDYAEAIQLFEAAYAMQPAPELLYNVARSYEKALRRNEAIVAYERFLAEPGSTAAQRNNARTALDELRKEEKALAQGGASVDQLDLAAPRPSSAAVGAPGVTTRPPSDGPSGARIASYALFGVGGAALATGAVLGILSSRAGNDASQQCSDGLCPEAAKADVDRQRSLGLAADASFVAGGVAAGVGLVLFLLSGDDDGRVAVAPAIGGDGAGLVLSGAF